MPLTRKVTFRGMLQGGKKVQVPKIIRWEFKLEPNQVLKVGFSVVNIFRGWQFFYGKMQNTGRISVPDAILIQWQGEKTSLSRALVEITLEPA